MVMYTDGCIYITMGHFRDKNIVLLGKYKWPELALYLFSIIK